MKILVTGGAGFIGSFLCEELLSKEHEVFVIDDLTTGSIANIKHLKKNPRFHFTLNDIKNEPVLAELVDECDLIFHLAAAVGVKLIVESPVRTIVTNIHGTETVLKLANKKKKKVILASTSEIYGKGSNIPFKEEEDIVFGPTIKSRWSYACSKAIDEFLALAYWKENKLPIVIVRLFNTVGPRQTGQYGMVIPIFVNQALSGNPITVYGSGKQTRCFAYVGDVIKGIIELAFHPEAVGEIFNIGNDREVSIDELARRVKVKASSNSEIIHVPYDEAYEIGFEDMMRRVPSLDKIRNLLDFSPDVELDEILDKVIEFHKNKIIQSSG